MPRGPRYRVISTSHVKWRLATTVDCWSKRISLQRCLRGQWCGIPRSTALTAKIHHSSKRLLCHDCWACGRTKAVHMASARQDMAQMKELAGSMAKRLSGMASKFMDDFDRY
eukprot:scaffold162904_cov15-Tisochrysis_lutea.AAC.1